MRAGPQSALIEIGRKMFFDRTLSASGQLACSSCHDPKYAYGPAPGHAIPRGGPRMNLPGTRAVPSLRYLQNVPPFAEQYHFIDGDVGPGGGYTWDGRAATLKEQALLPLLASNEMANQSPDRVVKRLARTSYANEFRNAFGAEIFAHPHEAFADAVAALEAFQHVPAEFFPYSSKYDAFLRGDADLTEQEERGVALFKDPAKANCASCHLTGIRNEVFPTFSDYDYMNAGVPRNPAIAANSDSKYYDLGLYGPARSDLAGRKEYCGFFRAPTLRNSALRDAFFHNGVFHSLREVVQFYVDRDIHPEKWYPHNADGSVRQFDDLPPECPNNVDKDPPLDRNPGDRPALTDAEIDDLVAFLETLTDGYAPPVAPASAATAASGLGRASSARPASGVATAVAPTTHSNASDQWAWRAFVAINWPADIRRRRANLGARFGDDAPATWETWQNVKDIFLLGGKDPGPWVSGDRAVAVSSATAGSATGELVAATKLATAKLATAKLATAKLATDKSAAARFDTGSFAAAVPTKHIVDGAMVPYDPIATATHLNETRINRAAFEYLRANELYNVDGQVAQFRKGIAPNFPAQSMEVKAQWRPIDEAQRARFHTTVVTLDDGTQRLYGLTALHIASKESGQWFWATFEHVDDEGNASVAAGQDGVHGSINLRAAIDVPGSADASRPEGMRNTVWANYRLRGTMSRPVDDEGHPVLLANSNLEAGVEHSSSCVTCHSRASIGVVNGKISRLPVLNTSAEPIGGDSTRGYVGLPDEGWYFAREGTAGDGTALEGTAHVGTVHDSAGRAQRLYLPLDFVWSLAKAQPRSSP